MSKLYFRYGAMNSGKTTLLLQVAHNYEERGMKVVILKPGIDTKGNDKIVTRIGLKRKVDHIIKQDEKLSNYLNKLSEDIVCILVDEAQFLSRDQVDELFMYTKLKNKPVKIEFSNTGKHKGDIRPEDFADDYEVIQSEK